jgi:hypothetical protein
MLVGTDLSPQRRSRLESGTADEDARRTLPKTEADVGDELSHAGHATAQSAGIGRGSEFVVRLPAQEGQDESSRSGVDCR